MTDDLENHKELLLKYITQARPKFEEAKAFSELFYIRSYGTLLRTLYIEDKIAIDTQQRIYAKTAANTAPTLPKMPVPSYPWPKELDLMQTKPRCAVCGMIFDGVMGYVCTNINCPSGVRYTSNV